MARGVVTRVLSVRCNDSDLALCAQFLARNEIYLATCSDIIKNVIGLVAQQAVRAGIETMPLQDAREFLAENYGNAGAHRNTHTYAQNAFSQRQMPQLDVDVIQQKPRVGGIELTGQKIMEFVQWLGEHGLTKDECSYEQYLQRLEQERKAEVQQIVSKYAEVYGQQEETIVVPDGCDPSLPIAVEDTPEELEERVAERRERENAEKLAMEQFTQGLLNGQKNS